MSDSLPSTTLKPQDKIAAGVLLGVALLTLGALGYGLFVILPYLIELAENTIIFFGELVVLVLLALGAVQLWTERDLLIYKWKNLARRVRKAIVREDPIGVLQTVIARFAAKLEQIDENIAQAVAARQRQDSSILKAERHAADARALATAAQRFNKSENEIGRHASSADRWDTAANEMRPMAALLAKMQSSLEGARDLCANRLEDLKDQKVVMAMKLDALQEGQRSVKAFKRFFGTNTDLEMQELAVEEIERQSSVAEAEIDQFMRVMDPILKTEDLKKQADAMQAMEKLNAFVATSPQKSLTDGSPITIPVREAVAVGRK